MRKSTCPSRPSACECCKSEFNKTANSIDKLNEKLNKTGDKISDAKTQAVELTQQIEGRAKAQGCAMQPKRRQIP